MKGLQRLKIDNFLLIMIAVVASLFPCEGVVKTVFEYFTTAAIALLFFMHGAKLSQDAIVLAQRYAKKMAQGKTPESVS